MPPGMLKDHAPNNGIPISISLSPSLEAEDIHPQQTRNKQRVVLIAIYAVMIAACISVIAKFLMLLINVITNLSFFGHFSLEYTSPAQHALGWLVIAVPAVGGLIVGWMALYGSRAIRGHGIPEAMEQILTNQSRIRPAITFLKPVSSAIAIGTGGPFGAEGPIIATGGALGSTFGQVLKITPNERKILLAAGATAGMATIFGSPIAAIFLAVELLLFEFSPRSIIPVALACITGAAGHHFFFEGGPVFAIHTSIAAPSNIALLLYSCMGILVGLLSVAVTKSVYLVEDLFEKLPVHWMWWPAIGGLAVGVIGYFSPLTLGVGYENITGLLSGNMPLKIVLSLCLLKFLSWVIALGSGTSGGTLAPLLTIGGAVGALLGGLGNYLFPETGLSISLAALVGMSAIFAGASRALLTSIIFALETTAQSNALLPLLASCTASYFVSFFLMKNTIMTEKIVRRGVKTPDSFEPDTLEKVSVEEAMSENKLVLSEDNSIGEVREWLEQENDYQSNFFIIVGAENSFRGIISSSSLFSHHRHPDQPVGSLIRRNNISISTGASLRKAVEMMAEENIDVLPVVSSGNQAQVIGVLSYKDIIAVYKHDSELYKHKQRHISLRRHSFKILVRGKRMIEAITRRE